MHKVVPLFSRKQINLKKIPKMKNKKHINCNAATKHENMLKNN